MHFCQSLSAEKDGLDIVQHEWALPKFEQRAEAVLRKLVSWTLADYSKLAANEFTHHQVELEVCSNLEVQCSLSNYKNWWIRSCSIEMTMFTFTIE